MKIDCYGYKSTSADYFKRKPQNADVAVSGNYTYIRFSTASTGPIHRIETANGVTSIRWAYGAWADRATLTYSLTLNEPMEIEA